MSNVRLNLSSNGGMVLTYTEIMPPKKGMSQNEATRYEDRYKDRKEVFTKDQHKEAVARMHEVSGTTPEKEEEEEKPEEQEEGSDEEGMDEKPTAMSSPDSRLPHEMTSED